MDIATLLFYGKSVPRTSKYIYSIDEDIDERKTVLRAKHDYYLLKKALADSTTQHQDYMYKAIWIYMYILYSKWQYEKRMNWQARII